MPRIRLAFEEFVSFSNLWIAFWKSYRATRNSFQAKHFHFYLERELLQLQQELLTGTYQPGKYRLFTIQDPKQRTISVAPFRDRVVHHALVNILEPFYEKSFIFDSYASRKEKGTFKAICRAQQYMRFNDFFLKGDVRKYFDSIDRGLLLRILRKKPLTHPFLSLIEKILQNDGENEKGVPIGNLTSQFFANVYLNELDHFVKDYLSIRYYVRYMDDFIVFAPTHGECEKVRKEIAVYLGDFLHLQLKEQATFINRCSNGIPFLGMSLFTGTVRIRRENFIRSLRRFRRREREILTHKISEEQLADSVQSIWSRFEFANTLQFRLKLVDKIERERSKAAPTV